MRCFPFQSGSTYLTMGRHWEKYKPWKTYLRFQSPLTPGKIKTLKKRKEDYPSFPLCSTFLHPAPGFLAAFLRVFLKPFVVVGFCSSFVLSSFLFFFLCVSMSPSDSSTLVFLRRCSLWCFLCNGVLAWWCFSSLWCFLSVLLP